MSEDSILKRNWVKGSAVLATAALSLVLAAPVQAAPLAKVKSATQGATENVVEVTFQGGDGADVKGRITFLEEGVFRYNVDPTGTFDEYAVPRQADHVAHIQAQPDSDSSYSHPKATVEDKDGAYLIKSGSTTIKLDKESAKMQVLVKDKEVMSETSPLDLGDSTVQSVSAGKGEGFFGGGTQNGRFAHRGKSIKIANTNNWVDGGVASPIRSTGRAMATEFCVTPLPRVRTILPTPIPMPPSSRTMRTSSTHTTSCLTAQAEPPLRRMFSTATLPSPVTRCCCRNTAFISAT